MGFFDIFKVGQFKKQIALLEQNNQNIVSELTQLRQKYAELGGFQLDEIKQMTAELQNSYSAKSAKLESDYVTRMTELDQSAAARQNYLQSQLKDASSKLDTCTAELHEKTETVQKLDKRVESQTKKLRREKELYNAMKHSLDCWESYEPTKFSDYLSSLSLEEANDYAPSVILKLHSMDIKSLRSAYKENDKQIDQLLKTYAARYTTKANKSIYQLMVIALRAELQNILTNLRYEKLDKAIEQVKTVTSNYLEIAGNGNQSIAGTLQKFIGEVEYLFINAVKIEYNYYVKKEQSKQEQAALREQMRQEAEERKALEAERKRIEAEEQKYNAELEKLNIQLKTAQDSEIEKLKARILELQGHLSEVAVKREEIATLSMGKAGNVYIISNAGSFGEGVFKVGMTRRLNPQERVDELGNASVPFRFDVHSFIFSNDAVGLETELHKRLNDKRVNKVNMRKEFFRVSLDELEQIVLEIDPTAEFRRTVAAEEFLQSQSSDENYTSEYTEFDDEDDDPIEEE